MKRDIGMILTTAHYYVVSRHHIQKLHFPEDESGRASRRRLAMLHAENYLQRSEQPVFNPRGGDAWPVFYPAMKGLELLAEHFRDDRFLLVPTRAPEPTRLLHWLAITDTHLALDQAVARQSFVKVEDWLSEWDIANKAEREPEKRYRLYTLLRSHPRLVCAPDVGFLLSAAAHSKVYYLEQDRGTSGVRQISVSKTPGYAEMARQQIHRRHFPNATLDTFTVLVVAPNEPRRDALRRAIHGKIGAELWRFASVTDVRPETFLHAPIFYPCQGDPQPLVRAPAPDTPPQPSTESNPEPAPQPSGDAKTSENKN